MANFDVIVLGGGPAGAAAALALQQKGFHTALVEPQPEKLFRVGETVPPAFQDLLAQLNAAKLLSKAHHLPSLGNQSAWGSKQPGHQDFFTTPHGRGWHLDRVRFEANLLAETKRRGVHLMPDFAFAEGERISNDHWKLKAIKQKQQEVTLCAPWVIDATGREAHFAQSQGIKPVHFDKLVGIGCLYEAKISKEQSSFTLIEASPDGWWYLASLPHNKWIVMFMTDSNICKEQKLYQPENWQTLLAQSQHIRHQIVQAKAAPAPSHDLWVTPASTRRLSQVWGEGWIAIGDAAFSMDPLSSAGIYKAVQHGLLAATALHDFEKGDAHAFDRYDQLLHRQFENYLADRRTYYRQEQRWSQHPFWQQRHERISLDPNLVLAPDASSGSLPWTRLKHLLPPHHWQKLWQYCDSATPAHLIIRKYMRDNPGEYRTERLIQALVYLVEKGMLKVAVSK